MENCQGMIGYGWMRFAIYEKLSGHAELSFWMQKYFSFTWQKRIKRKSKELVIQELPALSVAQGTFHVSAARICHFGSDVHCLPSALRLCFQPCGFRALCSEAMESFEDYLWTPPSTARWPAGMGSGSHASLLVWKLLVNMGCRTLLGLCSDMIRQQILLVTVSGGTFWWSV